MSSVASVSSAIAGLVTRRPPPGGLVLGYHDVGPRGSRPTPSAVPADLLEQHLVVLRRLGYQFVSLPSLLDDLARSTSVADAADRKVAVTFDDALAGVHAHGRAMLDRMGITATLFVVVDHVGAPDAPWWPGAGPVMTAGEIDQWLAAGHHVGSHTRTHRSLPLLAAAAGGLPDGDVREEVEGSRHQLVDRFGADVSMLAYPSGHHDPTVRRVVSEAGYRGAVTFLNGRLTADTDPFRIPRLTMGAHHGRLRLGYHALRRPWPDHQLDAVGPQ